MVNSYFQDMPDISRQEKQGTFSLFFFNFDLLNFITWRLLILFFRC